ncbi:MAG: hypothetical protein ACFFE4_15355 [Candidatus Thorarchaeota archaeon]
MKINKKVSKNKYLIEEELEEEEEDIEIKEEVILENQILKILSKNRVDSKLTLTNLLISHGIKDYELKLNLSSNQIYAEIPNIGRILKKLRFDKKINFSIIDGAHVYYIEKNKKMISRKKSEIKFNWESYKIPEGTEDIFLVFKIPSSNINSHHFLMSCFPSAEISGFEIYVDKNFEKTSGFRVKGNQITGYFENDKLIFNCKTSDENIDRTIYTLIQFGRKVLTELIKLNFRYSEILQIFFPIKSDFFPVVPVFRSGKQGIFYKTKYSNALRVFYDFPMEFKGKLIYGKHSLIVNGEKEEEFDIRSYYDFISDALEFQTKAFISLSILNDWVINPSKAMNYMEEDDDLKKLIEEYKQDIDTDRIIQERLEESLERGEFFKEITSNLLLTFLGVSLLADWPPLQWMIVAILIFINVYYFIKRRKKFKRRTQIV